MKDVLATIFGIFLGTMIAFPLIRYFFAKRAGENGRRAFVKGLIFPINIIAFIKYAYLAVDRGGFTPLIIK